MTSASISRKKFRENHKGGCTDIRKFSLTTPASQSGLCGRCPTPLRHMGMGSALILEVARGGLAVPCSAVMVLMAKARFARAFTVSRCWPDRVSRSPCLPPPVSRLSAAGCWRHASPPPACRIPSIPLTIARAPAVNSLMRSRNVKALLKVAESSTRPRSIKAAVSWHRHHCELMSLPTATSSPRNCLPSRRASARPLSLRLRWVAQSSKLELRPTGLGSGIDKDRPDCTAAAGMLVASAVLRCASRSQGHELIRRLECQGQ